MQKKTKQIIVISAIIAVFILLFVLMQKNGILIKKQNQQLANVGYTTQIGDKEYNITDKIENDIVPTLSAGMIPVKPEGEYWTIVDKGDTSWFNYTEGKSAYMMLNDGKYQSEEYYQMSDTKIVAQAGIQVSKTSLDLGSIYVWIPRYAYNDDGDVIYIRQDSSVAGSWTMPDIFSYNTDKEDYALAGIWIECKSNEAEVLTNKITQMNTKDSLYGFIGNTKTNTMTEDEQEVIQKFLESLNILAGGNTIYDLDMTNANHSVIRIINTNILEPVKAIGHMNNEEERVEIRIVHNSSEIEKIFDENGELTKQDNIYIQSEDDIISPHYVKDSRGNIREVEYDNVLFIRNAKELSKFRDKVNAGNNYAEWTIIQIADIDMIEECSEEIGSWTPIGISKDYYFSGKYNGTNRTISNLYIHEEGKYYVGLFGRAHGATLCNINVSGNIYGMHCVGGICGYSKDSISIINCTNNAIVTGTNSSIAGICGYARDNIKISNCVNNGTITANEHNVGGITGYNYLLKNSEIINCVNNAKISASIYNAGGICGAVCEYSSLNIKQCKNIGNITAGDSSVGGMIGATAEGTIATIDQCSNLGDASANMYSSGGCIGANINGAKVTISNSYNMGYISTGKGTGAGILGGMNNDNSNYGTPYATITNCYNAGVVKRVGSYGGILGWHGNNSWISLSNNYWELGKGAMYGIGVNSSNTGATPVYAETLKTYANKLGSEFSDDIIPNINIGYPILEWEKQTLPICAVVHLDETKENIIIEVTRNVNSITYVKNEDGENLSKISDLKYKESAKTGKHTYTIIDDIGNSKILEFEILFIDNVEALETFRDSVNAGNSYEGATIIQTADLDLSGVCGVNIESWVPIGDGSTYFKGTYDGGNYSISNLYLNNSNLNNAGLFGKIDGGKIYNLSVSGKVTGNTTNGGVCGYARGNNVEFVNCKNNVVVNGYTSCGGIVGAFTYVNNIKIINCENNANISSNQYNTGGIVGYVGNVSNPIISKCKNTGRCYSGMSTAGGIVGAADSKGSIYISECYNTGTQEAAEYAVGGIMGGCNIGMNALIENCYNIGYVAAYKGSAGGILGNMDTWDSTYGDPYTIINNCYNAGTIAQKGAYGGILGYTKTTGWYSLNNNYWETGKGASYGNWRGSSNAGATGVNAATLKTYASNLGSAYTNDTTNINNGYPILKWQAQ